MTSHWAELICLAVCSSLCVWRKSCLRRRDIERGLCVRHCESEALNYNLAEFLVTEWIQTQEKCWDGLDLQHLLYGHHPTNDPRPSITIFTFSKEIDKNNLKVCLVSLKHWKATQENKMAGMNLFPIMCSVQSILCYLKSVGSQQRSQRCFHKKINKIKPNQ